MEQADKVQLDVAQDEERSWLLRDSKTGTSGLESYFLMSHNPGMGLERQSRLGQMNTDWLTLQLALAQ